MVVYTPQVDVIKMYLVKSFEELSRTLDTIGKCQRPVLSLGVSQNMLKQFSSIGRRSCEITMKEKKQPCHMKLCTFRCLISRPQILNLRSRNQIRGKLLFLENNFTSEGAVFHNVLYY